MSESTPEPRHPADHDRIIRIPRIPDSEIDLTKPPAPAPPPPAPVVEVATPSPPPASPLRSDPLPPLWPYRDAELERARLIAAALVQAQAATAGNTATPPAATGFTTDWPLGMKADLAERKVRRGNKVADLGTSRPAWNVLVKLANNYPRRTAPDALWSKETELGAVYTAVSALRRFLTPLGITIPHPGRQGYLLSETPSPEP